MLCCAIYNFSFSVRWSRQRQQLQINSNIFVIEHAECVLSLIGQEKIATRIIIVSSILSRKHSAQFDFLSGQVRIDRVYSTKQSFTGQGMFFKASSSNSETMKGSFLISKAIAMRGKLFPDGNLQKYWLRIFIQLASPDKISMVESTSLLHQTLVWQVDDSFQHSRKSHSETWCVPVL